MEAVQAIGLAAIFFFINGYSFFGYGLFGLYNRRVHEAILPAGA